jgi:hypothetical protein
MVARGVSNVLSPRARVEPASRLGGGIDKQILPAIAGEVADDDTAERRHSVEHHRRGKAPPALPAISRGCGGIPDQDCVAPPVPVEVAADERSRDEPRLEFGRSMAAIAMVLVDQQPFRVA